MALSVDLADVVSVRADPGVACARAEDSEVFGIALEEPPRPEDNNLFFNINDPEKSIGIVLNERYARLVIEVEDLRPIVATIW